MSNSLVTPHRNRKLPRQMRSAGAESQQALAAAVARRLYGFAPSAVVRLRSGNNFVFRVEFGGLPAKVIKLPGRPAGLLREQRVIRALRQGRWALPVPPIEFTQDDVPPAWRQDEVDWVRPRAVTVMPLCPGMTLADAILRGEPWAGEAMRAAGAFAAGLTEVPAAVLGRARRVQTDAQIHRAMGRLQPVVEAFGLTAVVGPALEVVAEAKLRPAASLAHGAFYPENMRVEPAAGGVRLTVLDWKVARPSTAFLDLAALIASLTTLPLSDDGQRAYLRRRAINGFAALRPLSGRDERELRAWEAILLLEAAGFALAEGRESQARRLARAAEEALSS